MRSREYTIGDPPFDSAPLLVEEYASCSELLSVNMARRNTSGGALDIYTPRYFGADVRDAMVHGRGDLPEMDELGRIAMELDTDITHRYGRAVTGMVGGSVDVPLMLSGSPACMRYRRKEERRSRNIRLLVNLSAGYRDRQQEGYIEACTSITGAVRRLETSGYHVELDTVYMVRPFGSVRYAALIVPVKSANEPIRPSMMAFMLCDRDFTNLSVNSWINHLPKRFKTTKRTGTAYIPSDYIQDMIMSKILDPEDKVVDVWNLMSRTRDPSDTRTFRQFCEDSILSLVLG